MKIPNLTVLKDTERELIHASQRYPPFKDLNSQLIPHLVRDWSR
jgi:hypothetical protein